jgi:hypothetical protein
MKKMKMMIGLAIVVSLFACKKEDDEATPVATGNGNSNNSTYDFGLRVRNSSHDVKGDLPDSTLFKAEISELNFVFDTIVVEGGVLDTLFQFSHNNASIDVKLTTTKIESYIDYGDGNKVKNSTYNYYSSEPVDDGEYLDWTPHLVKLELLNSL